MSKINQIEIVRNILPYISEYSERFLHFACDEMNFKNKILLIKYNCMIKILAILTFSE